MTISDDTNPQTVERSQSASESDETICEDSGVEGHGEWACNRCQERLDRDFDEVLRRSMLTYQGWSEEQINVIGSLRQFDKTPWTKLMPDLTQPRNVQIRSWGWSCLRELQARMDAARKFHEVMTAQHHLQNEGKAAPTTSSPGQVVCKDSNGNELHPQWTCHHCLSHLDNCFDKLVREAMLDQGWTEAQIDAVGSLRQFDTKPWSEMIPDSSQPQLVRVRAWGSTRLDELEARMDNTRVFHKARIGSEKVVNKAEIRARF